jgi:hypothetical protein
MCFGTSPNDGTDLTGLIGLCQVGGPTTRSTKCTLRPDALYVRRQALQGHSAIPLCLCHALSRKGGAR